MPILVRLLQGSVIMNLNCLTRCLVFVLGSLRTTWPGQSVQGKAVSWLTWSKGPRCGLQANLGLPRSLL